MNIFGSLEINQMETIQDKICNAVIYIREISILMDINIFDEIDFNYIINSPVLKVKRWYLGVEKIYAIPIYMFTTSNDIKEKLEEIYHIKLERRWFG